MVQALGGSRASSFLQDVRAPCRSEEDAGSLLANRPAKPQRKLTTPPAFSFSSAAVRSDGGSAPSFSTRA